MKFGKKCILKTQFILACMLGVTSVEAATSLKDGFFKEFTKSSSANTMTVKAESWYNPTMGYTGWTHHSNWGFMKLTAGLPVTIKVSTSVAGLHPAISVWYRDKKGKIDSIANMNDHFYSPFNDIYEPNAIINDDPTNPIKIGKFKMEFIANAFDRDGMVAPLAEKFDQSMLNRVVDGVAGSVELTFTPKKSGWHQFAVGAINPDDGVNKTARHEVQVEVSFP